jgi:hypothetical protein
MTTGALARAIRRAGSRRQVEERCELCGVPVADGHRHAVDTERHEVLCVCYACSVVFNREAASQGHYRLIPQRRVRAPELSPASLGVPVGLAFFVVQRDGSVVAHYPSPAGATRWDVDPQAWAEATAACPALRDLAPEVEALLVNSARGRSEAWLVPVDDCYRLVAVVRELWQGLSGGDRVWPEIESFFEELRRRDGSDSSR